MCRPLGLRLTVMSGHAYCVAMNEQKHHAVVAVVGNPTSNNGKGAKAGSRVLELLNERGKVHGFGAEDLTGGNVVESIANIRAAQGAYDYLVVVGGDGMVSLGINAVASSGTPLGIVGVGSGNDFARGLELPVNRIETAVEGIVGAIVCGSCMSVDMGYVDRPSAADSEPLMAGDGYEDGRFFAGMLSCGIDASINDRANHSRLPGGSLRYFAAALMELLHMKRYGYRVSITTADGDTEERDIVTPLLTVANSRHIGGGIEVSPYSSLDDGLLDMVWMNRMPGFIELMRALRHAYDGRLLTSRFLSWQRVRSVCITCAGEGDEPPAAMADGEYVGSLPLHVVSRKQALRVLVPPAVVDWHGGKRGGEQIGQAIERDGRSAQTGEFAR